MKFFNLYFNDDINSILLEKRERHQRGIKTQKMKFQKTLQNIGWKKSSQPFFQIPKNSTESVLYPLADYYKNQ